MKRVTIILAIAAIVGLTRCARLSAGAHAIATSCPPSTYSVLSFNTIKGCWGTDAETGNSIFCITSPDSLFWVDASLWCYYTIENDTITMMSDDWIYYIGRISYKNDTIILSNDESSFSYERYQQTP